ncbi:MAG: dephospho-CoA kinase [Acidimicrobiaceae bacterium]|nr:dephospho-CoA kinase [Acidimicrobiaceae bacterium]
MLVVGLTGGIGSGKSTVASLLAARGAVVIDADQVAREVASPGGASYQTLVDHFGPGVVRADGTLDRAAIAYEVFSDPEELAALNAITHPAIAAAIAARLASLAEVAGPRSIVVLDIPLVTEATRARYRLAGVIVVDAPHGVALRRLVEQRAMSESDAEARLKAQMSRADRRTLADVVIDNQGTRRELEAGVDRAWEWLEGLLAAQR